MELTTALDGPASSPVGARSPTQNSSTYCPSADGHGYATEAAGAVLHVATATGRTVNWPAVRPGDPASLRVLEELGFTRHFAVPDQARELMPWEHRT